MRIDISFKNAILKARGSKLLNGEPNDKVVVNHRKQTDLENVLFAPHPIFGFPCNDMEIMNDSKVSPELRSALEQRNQVINNTGISSIDDDVILDSMKSPYESDEQYIDRLKSVAQSVIDSDSDKKESEE